MRGPPPLCHTTAMGLQLGFRRPATLLAFIWISTLYGQAPRPFSPKYVQALKDILSMEEPEAVRLEQQLARQPENESVRLRLIAYHYRADRATQPEDLAKRRQLVLWLIEHRPASEVLLSPYSRFQPGQLPPAVYQRAIALWSRATAAKSTPPTVLWNAATFFQNLDQARYLQYMEATAAADPNHPFALRPLAHYYAEAMLARSPQAARAQAALEASNNVWILGNAANRLHLGGSPLAERYFLRAKAIDPALDRQQILPVIEHKVPIPAVNFDSAVAKIQHLPISAFPGVPPVIAKVLNQRQCAVPQPYGSKAPANLIQGEFFAPGETAWAVLCSVRQVTTFLVFRNATDANPSVLNTGGERNHLQGLGGIEVGYSRQIASVNRAFIMRHHRAYGGPRPPAILHHGIDDAFLGKASVTWYFHEGRWLSLQGAD